MKNLLSKITLTFCMLALCTLSFASVTLKNSTNETLKISDKPGGFFTSTLAAGESKTVDNETWGSLAQLIQFIPATITISGDNSESATFSTKDPSTAIDVMFNSDKRSYHLTQGDNDIDQTLQVKVDGDDTITIS